VVWCLNKHNQSTDGYILSFTQLLTESITFSDWINGTGGVSKTYKTTNFAPSLEPKNNPCFSALREISDPSIGTRILEYNKYHIISAYKRIESDFNLYLFINCFCPK
jgi:hypothetical protein